MEDFKDLIYYLETKEYSKAYRKAEELRKRGLPLTAIRSKIYDTFLYFKRNERKTAEEIVKRFKNYGLEGWLKD